MSTEPIEISLEESTHAGLSLTRNGQPVSLEEALTQGFIVTKEDAAAVLTWCANFVHNRDHAQI